jgi:glycosyltransferase involved in cell wall biosynthesis
LYYYLIDFKMKLSVIIPTYNEVNTLAQLIALVTTVLPHVDKELVIIDDFSTDGTTAWLRRQVQQAQGCYKQVTVNKQGNLLLTPALDNKQGQISFKILFHDFNQGKGAALRTGLAVATGEVLVIQDADLEYDPTDWERMWPLIAEQALADVVYGSRFSSYAHRSLQFHHWFANKLLSVLFSILYNQKLNDVEVCYKMFTREVLNHLTLTAHDFGFEIEFSAQVARARRWRIYEVGIHYYGRDYQQGKKINWKDGLKALWYLLKYRF